MAAKKAAFGGLFSDQGKRPKAIRGLS